MQTPRKRRSELIKINKKVMILGIIKNRKICVMKKKLSYNFLIL